jgi:hypothetical protein
MNSQPILSKESSAGGFKIPNFTLYYKAIEIKTAWYWPKNRHEDHVEQTRGPRYESIHLYPPYF